MNVFKLLKAEQTFFKVFLGVALTGSILTHYLVVLDLSKNITYEIRKLINTGLGNTAFEYGDSNIEHVEPISDYIEKSNRLMGAMVDGNFLLITNIHVRIEMIDLVPNPIQVKKSSWYMSTAYKYFYVTKANSQKKITYSIISTPNFILHAIIWFILFIIIRSVWRITPTPFSQYQNNWRKIILDSDRTGSDLDDANIDTFVEQIPLDDPYGKYRIKLFSILHNEHKITVKEAINELMQPKLEQLDKSGWHWLLIALKQNKSLDESIDVALMQDTLVIDVTNKVLFFRGLSIEMAGTPLAFYGWYLLQRKSVDGGWVPTPDANKDYPQLAKDLANIFEEWNVHSRGSVFNQEGTILASRFKTNRSRIKSSIEDELDGYADIASPYLFETRKMAFRVTLKPENITII